MCAVPTRKPNQMYETFYNFRAKPFRLSPDPRFFFNSSGHKRALAYLRYGVKQGEGFIVITGNVGTGKTTLVGALLKSLEHENVVAAQVVSTQLQADDLLRMVAAAFGLPIKRIGKAALLTSLESYFRAIRQEGKRALLVVDEAQGLPRKAIEELRMLSNFSMNGEPLLQSFLLGQREFRNTMRSEGFEQLRQRVIAAYHLKPLNAEETRGYIEHRLLTAGWQGDPKVDDAVYQGVYEYADGVPRRINNLCDRLFLFACLEELHALTAETLATVTQELLEEQSDGDVEPELPVLKAAKPVKRLSKPAPKKAPVADDRLAAVEESMSVLVGTLREELAGLRHALEKKNEDKPE